ncbi:hypothetical protein DFH08DRAFT_817832 [Mycena albidolilacea]|uniref:Uncharacterized protein n=1 Tax=Mycena albidolilacea TaxID=1033008 RepID=A0AAD6ZHQ1_9AGAR|nr:hypothetical protein DFH08DRAFT_817832 [Mycena albidolilacea]
MRTRLQDLDQALPPDIPPSYAVPPPSFIPFRIHAVNHPSLSHSATRPPAPRLLLRLLRREICFPAPSRQPPEHTGRQAGARLGPVIPVPPPLSLSAPLPSTPMPRSSAHVVYLGRSARIRYCHPNSSWGAVLRAGGARGEQITSHLCVLVLGSSGCGRGLRGDADVHYTGVEGESDAAGVSSAWERMKRKPVMRRKTGERTRRQRLRQSASVPHRALYAYLGAW